MTIWNKIVLGTKALIGDYEGAMIYLLDKVLNPWLVNEKVKENTKKLISVCESVFTYTYKYEKWIPSAFKDRFAALRSAIEELISALEDGVLTEDEIKAIKSKVQIAIYAFYKDPSTTETTKKEE